MERPFYASNALWFVVNMMLATINILFVLAVPQPYSTLNACAATLSGSLAIYHLICFMKE